jgi:hypothetical protein|tara:strand:- start:1682 stop:2296 length:615 start_codon:yes stop_codon:yes gene_type:complete
MSEYALSDLLQHGSTPLPDVIIDTHDNVSNIDTPKSFVKNKMGADYVEFSYMRDVADKNYPGWSWTVIKTETLGSEAFMVHGRLKWFDGGIWRNGDCTAAHRIQTRREGSGFVDIGNDIKAANTDCIKKAFNMYLNIADDVYRNRVEDVTLTQDDLDIIEESMEGLSEEWRAKILSSVENGEVERRDVKKVLARIEMIKQEENE